MYEAKQNKEKVSRRIDSISGGAHQRVKKTYSSKFRMIQFFGVHTLDNDRNLLYQQASARINAIVNGNAQAAQLIENALFPNLNQNDVKNNTEEHHIIPKSLFTNAGINGNHPAFNTQLMGVVLPSTIGLSSLFGRKAHIGPHLAYTFGVSLQLSRLSQQHRFGDINAFLRHYSANYLNKQDPAIINVDIMAANEQQNLQQYNPGMRLI